MAWGQYQNRHSLTEKKGSSQTGQRRRAGPSDNLSPWVRIQDGCLKRIFNSREEKSMVKDLSALEVKRS